AEEDEAGVRKERAQEGNAQAVLRRLLEQADRTCTPAPDGRREADQRIVEPATAPRVPPVLLRAPEGTGLRAEFELETETVRCRRVEVGCGERVRLPAAEARMIRSLEHLVALIGERPELRGARQRLEQHARSRAWRAEDDDRIPDHTPPAIRRSRASAGGPRCAPRPRPIASPPRCPPRPRSRRASGAGDGAGSRAL